MRIIDLLPDAAGPVRQAAALLVEGFKEHWPNAWPDIDAALKEVRESFGADRMSRIAVDDAGTVLGWIGGIRQRRGHVWELHPLCVRPDRQRAGVGRALVSALEAEVAKRGGITLQLGSDDHVGTTSLGNVDLYPDVLDHLVNIRNVGGHPYEFYLKVGFSLVGVLPDANGPGKPDIFLAKRVGGAPD